MKILRGLIVKLQFLGYSTTYIDLVDGDWLRVKAKLGRNTSYSAAGSSPQPLRMPTPGYRQRKRNDVVKLHAGNVTSTNSAFLFIAGRD